MTSQPDIDPLTVLNITYQLMDAYDIVHASGRTFNDLKPQNIMVEHDKDGELYIVLIDFGFSDKFLTAQGDHITNSELKDSFQGVGRIITGASTAPHANHGIPHHAGPCTEISARAAASVHQRAARGLRSNHKRSTRATSRGK